MSGGRRVASSVHVLPRIVSEPSLVPIDIPSAAEAAAFGLSNSSEDLSSPNSELDDGVASVVLDIDTVGIHNHGLLTKKPNGKIFVCNTCFVNLRKETASSPCDVEFIVGVMACSNCGASDRKKNWLSESPESERSRMTNKNCRSSKSSAEVKPFSKNAVHAMFRNYTKVRTAPFTSEFHSKLKLILKGDLQLCRVVSHQKFVHKLLNSSLLRRWEMHHLVLGDSGIHSWSPTGYMVNPIWYSSIIDVKPAVIIGRVGRGDHYRHVFRIDTENSSYYFRVSSWYIAEQWCASINWKREIFCFRQIVLNTNRPEVILANVKKMVEMSLRTPLQDKCVLQLPLDIVSNLLSDSPPWMTIAHREEILMYIQPLVDNATISPRLCSTLTDYCRSKPRANFVEKNVLPIVTRALKHTVDFSQHPFLRGLIQEYIAALYSRNDGSRFVREFVEVLHAVPSKCPHPRILPNLVCASLAGIFEAYKEDDNVNPESLLTTHDAISCYILIFKTMASYEDWRPLFGQILQPIPFPAEALHSEHFLKQMASVVTILVEDSRCEVHQTVMGVRNGKEGWLDVFAPTDPKSSGECTQAWIKSIGVLFHCCWRRKSFLSGLSKLQGALELLSLREDRVAQEVLCTMLEWDVIVSKDSQLQAVTTLCSTPSGTEQYKELVERRTQLKALQQKGGPKKFTLPSRSTDEDVVMLLSGGALGDLECLSLAFTNITSKCAEELIKLPHLKYLNLWSTRFGDQGLQVICEHLYELQVLNLCETPVSDKGIKCLISLKNLRQLNLNSTWLSSDTFELLKSSLPHLEEIDVRYTDAWS